MNQSFVGNVLVVLIGLSKSINVFLVYSSVREVELRSDRLTLANGKTLLHTSVNQILEM